MAKVINENIVRDFVKALKAERKKPSAYDTTAKVLRVDGDTAWVHIAGGVDETPVKLTVNAEKGDEVQVRVGGGKAWIVGNATAPPTDDKTANIAHKRAVNADNKAVAAKQTAEEADVKADTAKEKADEAIEAVGASITTDTLHYLATSLDSGVTINTPGWTTTVQTMTSTNRYLWTYHTYHKASGQSVNTNPVITGVYGQTGPQGEPGTAGTSITITNIRYAISTTESQPADSSFTYTSVPSVPEGNWLWTRTLYSDNSKVYTKAKQGETGPQGATGDDGVSITAVQSQYNLSTSTSSATGTWSNTLTYETGKYIWTREKITYSNNTTGYSTAIYNEALTSACANAEDALTMAEKIEQHFWTDEDGAHVTEVTQEEYLDDPIHAGGNSLITANGMSIRKGVQTLLSTDEDSIDFYTYDEDSDTFIPSASLTANKMTFFNSGGEIGLNVISGLGDNVLGVKADGGVFIGDESAYRATGHGAFIHTGTDVAYDDSPTIHLYARTQGGGGGHGSSNLAGIEIVASDTYTPSNFVEIKGELLASPIRSNSYKTNDGAELGSYIELKGEDDETITLGTSDKYPAMKKLVEKKGNAFSHNTTSNCIECLYDGTIIVQAKIRLGVNYTAQDIIGYGLYNMDEDTNFAASRFRVPPNMTAPNQDVLTMATPVVVSAGDRIRIRIRNATGARGIVQNDNTVITATFIAPYFL